jgi:hypothetical protein
MLVFIIHRTRPHRLKSRLAAAYGHRRILRTRSHLWSSIGLSGQSRINKVLPRSSLALQQLGCYQPSYSSSCARPKVELKYFRAGNTYCLYEALAPFLVLRVSASTTLNRTENLRAYLPRVPRVSQLFALRVSADRTNKERGLQKFSASIPQESRVCLSDPFFTRVHVLRYVN